MPGRWRTPEPSLVPVEDGSIGHAEIRVGNTIVFTFDRRPDWPTVPSLLRVYVADAELSGRMTGNVSRSRDDNAPS